jgi:hypothetical protein
MNLRCKQRVEYSIDWRVAAVAVALAAAAVALMILGPIRLATRRSIVDGILAVGSRTTSSSVSLRPASSTRTVAGLDSIVSSCCSSRRESRRLLGPAPSERRSWKRIAELYWTSSIRFARPSESSGCRWGEHRLARIRQPGWRRRRLPIRSVAMSGACLLIALVSAQSTLN